MLKGTNKITFEYNFFNKFILQFLQTIICMVLVLFHFAFLAGNLFNNLSIKTEFVIVSDQFYISSIDVEGTN